MDIQTLRHLQKVYNNKNVNLPKEGVGKGPFTVVVIEFLGIWVVISQEYSIDAITNLST